VDWINVSQNRDKCAGFCEHGNELVPLIKRGQFIEQLKNYQLLMAHSISRSQYISLVSALNVQRHSETALRLSRD
jgi:hypothetical protein